MPKAMATAIYPAFFVKGDQDVVVNLVKIGRKARMERPNLQSRMDTPRPLTEVFFARNLCECRDDRRVVQDRR